MEYVWGSGQTGMLYVYVMRRVSGGGSRVRKKGGPDLRSEVVEAVEGAVHEVSEEGRGGPHVPARQARHEQGEVLRRKEEGGQGGGGWWL